MACSTGELEAAEVAREQRKRGSRNSVRATLDIPFTVQNACTSILGSQEGVHTLWVISCSTHR